MTRACRTGANKITWTWTKSPCPLFLVPNMHQTPSWHFPSALQLYFPSHLVILPYHWESGSTSGILCNIRPSSSSTIHCCLVIFFPATTLQPPVSFAPSAFDVVHLCAPSSTLIFCFPICLKYVFTSALTPYHSVSFTYMLTPITPGDTIYHFIQLTPEFLFHIWHPIC